MDWSGAEKGGSWVSSRVVSVMASSTCGDVSCVALTTAAWAAAAAALAALASASALAFSTVLRYDFTVMRIALLGLQVSLLKGL